MLIHSLWFWRKTEAGPELLLAWDAHSVDQNVQGWETLCERMLDEVRDDMSGLGYRYIDIEVKGDDAIETAFYPKEVEAEVHVESIEGPPDD